jgi:hypothetical protein
VSSLPKERIILEKVIFWYIFLIAVNAHKQ